MTVTEKATTTEYANGLDAHGNHRRMEMAAIVIFAEILTASALALFVLALLVITGAI